MSRNVLNKVDYEVDTDKKKSIIKIQYLTMKIL